MKRGEDLRWSQLKVGILLVVGFLVLLWVSFNSDLGSVFDEETLLGARFPSAEGLVAGSPVLFLGMETGQVRSVELVPAGGAEPIRMTFTV
ncbi:MAG: MCE family protein, partial [Gemmatimonadetes bacterium]|nr:MCE family protein [Gemmatimonadota bacterium]